MAEINLTLSEMENITKFLFETAVESMIPADRIAFFDLILDGYCFLCGHELGDNDICYCEMND